MGNPFLLSYQHMIIEKKKKRVAILGGGPSALFVYKKFVESNRTDLEIYIIESKTEIGPGMPYSSDGSNDEHITNVSDNEIPEIVTTIEEWIQTVPEETLTRFKISKERFNEYKVLPRLLFGQYLSAQFDLLLEKAEDLGLKTVVHRGSTVTDMIDEPEKGGVCIVIEAQGLLTFDHVIICTGHKWPVKHEGKVKGYFDSPYPPAKLKLQLNRAVAIKGSSLTAIDAIRTLSRSNGRFQAGVDGTLSYLVSSDSPDFKIVMHSRSGLLPAIRFHLEEPLLSSDSLLSREELAEHMAGNGGFLSLDFVFQKDFKELFIDKDPRFYQLIKDLSLEEFVAAMMDLREKMDPFKLFMLEYEEAGNSIRKQESIHWKEMLAVLSFAMNYPAKYLSAEDMLRLQKVLMPLIAIVIAFVPQSSAQELLALHSAGRLDIVSVGEESRVEVNETEGVTYHYVDDEGEMQQKQYLTFVDCVGQPHLSYDDFPFKSLVTSETLSPARIKFRSEHEGKRMKDEGDKNVEMDKDGVYFLKVPGVTINDCFQVVDRKGTANDRICIMAVPYIGGYNPDYSGLDFCEQASESIVGCIIEPELASPSLTDALSPAEEP
jgi:uncharacterized NAD(P)/FAD-binding protein YdhS